jgi:hypothetical protein
MTENLITLTQTFLEAYPGATGATLQSLETSLDISVGENTEIIRSLNEMTILGIDESFDIEFSYIFSDHGTVIVFFIDPTTFLSVFTTDEFPNKALAKQMFDTYQKVFLNEFTSENQTR